MVSIVNINTKKTRQAMIKKDIALIELDFVLFFKNHTNDRFS